MTPPTDEFEVDLLDVLARLVDHLDAEDRACLAGYLTRPTSAPAPGPAGQLGDDLTTAAYDLHTLALNAA